MTGSGIFIFQPGVETPMSKYLGLLIVCLDFDVCSLWDCEGARMGGMHIHMHM